MRFLINDTTTIEYEKIEKGIYQLARS